MASKVARLASDYPFHVLGSPLLDISRILDQQSLALAHPTTAYGLTSLSDLDHNLLRIDRQKRQHQS